MASSFTKKKIKLTFILGTGTWGEHGEDTLVVENLRAKIDVVMAGKFAVSVAQIQVYGLTLEHMNKMSTLGLVFNEVPRNKIKVEAGDENGLSLIFTGQILQAWADFMTMPEVSFNVMANAMGFAAIRPVEASSYQGEVDVSAIFKDLAAKCSPPLTLENNGVDTKIANEVLPGTALEQIRQLAEHAKVDWIVDNDILAIWPQGQSRKAEKVFLISKDTGMRGYPAFQQNAIRIQMLFEPKITFGTKIEVKSDLTPANGYWNIVTLAYNLESELPNGNWFQTMECNRPGQFPFASLAPK